MAVASLCWAKAAAVAAKAVAAFGNGNEVMSAPARAQPPFPTRSRWRWQLSCRRRHRKANNKISPHSHNQCILLSAKRVFVFIRNMKASILMRPFIAITYILISNPKHHYNSIEDPWLNLAWYIEILQMTTRVWRNFSKDDFSIAANINGLH